MDKIQLTMKKHLITLFSLVSIFCYSQEKLSNLTIPNSPASSALGIQPTQILKPKSYQALETALFSNFYSESDGIVLPKDFSLEFTPFWANNHGISLTEYLFPDFKEQFFRNSSFSLASTQNFRLEDSSKINGMGFGYRTSFFFNNKFDKNEVKQYQDSIIKSQEFFSKVSSQLESIYPKNSNFDRAEYFVQMESIIKELIFELKLFNSSEIKEAEEFVDQIMEETKNLPFEKEQLESYINDIYLIIDRKLATQEHFDHFKSYLKKRHGFSVDVAYASFLAFPTNNFEFSYLPHHYFWITPTFSFKNKLDFLDFSGVLRYEKYNSKFYDAYFPSTQVFSNNLNYGFGLSTTFSKFSFQFELIGRNSFGFVLSGVDIDGENLYKWNSKSDLQYVGTFNYNINEGIVLTYSIGNRFDPIRNPESTFISALSLNLGFGGPDKHDLILGESPSKKKKQ
jgi:hypothetical protein